MTNRDRANVRAMTNEDLSLVFNWRNHPEVRRFMYTQHLIAFDEHVQWFSRASVDASRYLLIFEQDAVPLGFINIHQVAHGGIADWGFYVAPNAPKGTGTAMGRTVLQFAFEQAKLHKLCGQALVYNAKSIQFHLKLGFRQEGVLRQHHFDGNEFHDIACFGILAHEWAATVP